MMPWEGCLEASLKFHNYNCALVCCRLTCTEDLQGVAQVSQSLARPNTIEQHGLSRENNKTETEIITELIRLGH